MSDISIKSTTVYTPQPSDLTPTKTVGGTVGGGTVQGGQTTLPPVGGGSGQAQAASLTPTASLPGNIGTSIANLQRALGNFDASAKTVTGGTAGPTTVTSGAEATSTSAAPITGDIGRLLGRLLIEVSGLMKQAALDERMAAREAAMAELKQQAAALESAADKMMTGAITNAVVSGLAAAISIAGAAYSFKGQAAEASKMGTSLGAQKGMIDDLKNPTIGAVDKAAITQKLDLEVRTFSTFTTNAQLATTGGQLAESIAGIGKSVGASTDSTLQAQAKKDDAQASREAATAEYAKNLSEDNKEVQQAMAEMITKLVDFLKQMAEAETDAMRAVTTIR